LKDKHQGKIVFDYAKNIKEKKLLKLNSVYYNEEMLPKAIDKLKLKPAPFSMNQYRQAKQEFQRIVCALPDIQFNKSSIKDKLLKVLQSEQTKRESEGRRDASIVLEKLGFKEDADFVKNARDDSVFEQIIQTHRNKGQEMDAHRVEKIRDAHAYNMLLRLIVELMDLLNTCMKVKKEEQGVCNTTAEYQDFKQLKETIWKLAYTEYVKQDPGTIVVRPSTYLYFELFKFKNPGCLDKNNKHLNINYYQQHDRERFRIHLIGGKFYKINLANNGDVIIRPFTTISNGYRSHGKDDWVCFVMNSAGECFAHSHNDVMLHSSFMSGASVIYAGEMKTAKDGTPTDITTYTGHYLSKYNNLLNSANNFSRRGVAVSQLKFQVVDDKELQRQLNDIKPPKNTKLDATMKAEIEWKEAKIYHAFEQLEHVKLYKYRNGHLLDEAPEVPPAKGVGLLDKIANFFKWVKNWFISTFGSSSTKPTEKVEEPSIIPTKKVGATSLLTPQTGRDPTNVTKGMSAPITRPLRREDKHSVPNAGQPSSHFFQKGPQALREEGDTQTNHSLQSGWTTLSQ
jgi:hypothetical protein